MSKPGYKWTPEQRAAARARMLRRHAAKVAAYSLSESARRKIAQRANSIAIRAARAIKRAAAEKAKADAKAAAEAARNAPLSLRYSEVKAHYLALHRNMAELHGFAGRPSQIWRLDWPAQCFVSHSSRMMALNGRVGGTKEQQRENRRRWCECVGS